MSVDILMATYNGGKYLRNQLLSLQQQTYSDWMLLVRDDGSTDNTLSILDQFTKTDGRIKIVKEDSGKGLGPGKNFLGLTQYASADYVIFCDQDDIWFEKKLEVLVTFADIRFEKCVPCLVYCDAHGYSDVEGVISINSVSCSHAKNLREFLFFNAGYQGCSMLFNHSLCRMAASYRAEYFYMHDDVVSILAHAFGRVSFLPKPLMLYRQHASNVTGNVDVRLASKIKRIINRSAYVLSTRHYLEKKNFYESYRSELDSDTLAVFSAYLSYPEASFLKRVWLVLHHGFSFGGNKINLILKTIIRRPIE